MKISFEHVNPFRPDQGDLDKDKMSFLEDFAGATKEELKAAGIEDTGNDENRITNDEAKPLDVNQFATPEEIERHENELVECGGIEVTRKQERQLKEIERKINQERAKDGLEAVELGKEILLHKIEIGGKSKEELLEEMTQQEMVIDPSSLSLIDDKNFTVQKSKQQIVLLELSPVFLGAPWGSTVGEIFDRASELGMQPCPAETGLRLRPKFQPNLLGQRVDIAMNEIINQHGGIGIFDLSYEPEGVTLYATYMKPTDKRFLSSPFIFCLA